MEKKTAHNQVIKYAASPLATLMIVSIVLWLKQIFPFGTNTIDYYDMGQQIAAFYYHVYDALHGTKSLFFDWYSALGTNMTMNTSGCSSISVFNLLLYFVPRDGILQALSIFTMVKMACMSFTMYLFLHKTIRADAIWEFCFSVCYGLCGFAMMYYITNQWLDVAVVLPLLAGAVWKLLTEERTGSYILWLTVCLVGSYYQSCMILIFIILGTGVYYFTIGSEDQEKRYTAVWRLFTATLTAVGLSAFILIPQLLQTFGSTRFENNHQEGNFYLNILRQVKGVYTTRWWALLGLSLPFAVIVQGIMKGIRRNGSFRNYWKSSERKHDLFFVIMILMMCLELLFESINLMWHFGSYVGYPIRNGFIISLMVLTAACYYAKREENGRQENDRSQCFKILTGLVATGILAGLVIHYYNSRPDWILREVFHLTALVCGVSFVLYMLLIWGHTYLQKSKSDKENFCLTAVVNLLMAELIIFAYMMLGKPAYTTGYSEQAEQSGSYIAASNELVEKLEIDESTISRIKNPDTELNANYPFVMRRASLSNWTHMIEPSFQQGAVDWGYSIQYMRVLDAGGTVFSDALLGIRQVLSVNELPEELYTEAGRTVTGVGEAQREFILYDCNYVLPFGIVIAGNEKREVTQDRFSMQNNVYALMQPEQEAPLIETLCIGDGVSDAHQSFEIIGQKALYFSGFQADSDVGNMTIMVNGENVIVPTIGSPTQTSYPAYFNNNMICLGVFEDETVDVEVYFSELEADQRLEQDECFVIGALDLSKLQALCDQYKTEDIQPMTTDTQLSAIVKDAPKGSALLLPVKYDTGFQAEVNGQKTETSQAFGMFTAIPLVEDTNQITMKFFPKGMKVGCAISMIVLLIWNAVWYRSIRKSKAITDKTLTIYKTVWVIFVTGWSAAVLLMYVIPILYAPFALLFG